MMARQRVPTAAELADLETSCNLLYLRLYEAIENQLEPAGQWWPIAALCAMAIDALATGTSKNGVSTKTGYLEFVKVCPALADYAPIADRFYASVRSGLIHTLMPKHVLPPYPSKKKSSGKRKRRIRFGPAAISGDDVAPHIAKEAADPKRNHLVIGVPHLLRCTKRMLEDFRKGPITRKHRRFMKRFKQIIWEDTSAGLVPRP
jgi:hypothetical protein